MSQFLRTYYQISTVRNIDVKTTTVESCFTEPGFGKYDYWDKDNEIPLIQLLLLEST